MKPAHVRRFIFTATFSVICCFVFAQTVTSSTLFDNERISSIKDSSDPKIKGNIYFNIGPVFMEQSYKDFIVSPNTYISNGFMIPLLKFGLEKHYPTYSGYLNLLAGTQHLNDVPGYYYGDDRTSLLTFKLNTSRTWHVKDLVKQRIRWSTGYLVNAEYTHRFNEKFQNAAYAYDIWSNAGLSNRFEYKFKLKTGEKILFVNFKNPEQKFQIGWQLGIPLAGAITRPNYAGIRHFANGAFLSNLSREMKTNLEFTSLHNFVMLQSQIELLAPLANNNTLRIAYQWQAFRYNNSLAKLQGVSGGLEVAVAFKIDGREMIDR
ncbi:MAG: hypothetical protein H0V65_04700 [Chitinophagales bacterium]|nr:hypothetical protein [Chitinophagales bacterium]